MASCLLCFSVLCKNAEASPLGTVLLTQHTHIQTRMLTNTLHTQTVKTHSAHPQTPPNIRTQCDYLDDLNAEGVIVRVAALVKGKTERLVPVDGDTVEVLVC